MPYLHSKYYSDGETPVGEQMVEAGYIKVRSHPLLSCIPGGIYLTSKHTDERNSAAYVSKEGKIYVNSSVRLSPKQWAYVIAHCLLHLAFGHFDYDNIPYSSDGTYRKEVWNKACDIYINRFLADIKFGEPLQEDPGNTYSIKLNSEKKIYEHLIYLSDFGRKQTYGTNSEEEMDMIGLEQPIVYKKNECNQYASAFANGITNSVTNAVSEAGGHDWDSEKETPVIRAVRWFLNHYPLLGGIASSFKIIEDYELCQKYEIHTAAVDASIGEIYINPISCYSEEEWRFILAHEFLHAGLEHHKRCQGRDKYLWNVACDYVINDWLIDMKIGSAPEDVLYDKDSHGLSAESIYDRIIKEARRYKKCATFHGYNHGDIMVDHSPHFDESHKGISLDDFFKTALREGLDFHITGERGYLPAGLVEEIRALSMPPIPWEVELGKWFDSLFPTLEKSRSYARPSRRQGATPDIPRPNYILRERDLDSRTFGVVIDTSGSMSETQIGLGLGAIASYATAKAVPFVRVVFCDAEPYDAGYMSPEDIAGNVEVTGRGGTILQPAVTLLEKAKDFPAKGPILIITDGWIEDKLQVTHEHAYLLPKGNRLPFAAGGKVFYFEGGGGI